jgi:hypothetical protein
MTEAQVLASFGGEAVPWEENDHYGLTGSVKIPKAQVGTYQFEVRFYFEPKSKTLKEIRLVWLVSSYEGANAGSDKPPISADFDSLEQLLIQKYSKPSSDATENRSPQNLTRRASWVLPSTTVELAFNESNDSIVMSSVTIDYKQAAVATTLDKL